MASNAKVRTLAGTVGAGAAALLLAYVPQFEGMILRGYKDPIGIVTACAGHTKTAVLGRPYTQAECTLLLQDDLIEHADGVLSCTPQLAGHSNQTAAMVSFAYNVGVGAYCGSTAAKLVRSGDLVGACNQLPRWTYAGGKQLTGLVKRRTVERDLCLSDLR